MRLKAENGPKKRSEANFPHRNQKHQAKSIDRSSAVVFDSYDFSSINSADGLPDAGDIRRFETQSTTCMNLFRPPRNT